MIQRFLNGNCASCVRHSVKVDNWLRLLSKTVLMFCFLVDIVRKKLLLKIVNVNERIFSFRVEEE